MTEGAPLLRRPRHGSFHSGFGGGCVLLPDFQIVPGLFRAGHRAAVRFFGAGQRIDDANKLAEEEAGDNDTDSDGERPAEGDVSCFTFSSMMMNAKSTIMAPAYTRIWRMPRKWAPSPIMTAAVAPKERAIIMAEETGLRMKTTIRDRTTARAPKT